VPKPSVTRTIRLDKELDEAIQRIAEDEKVTVNSLVNRSLRKFLDWDFHSDKLGVVGMPPWMSVELMGKCSADEARELGKRVATLTRPVIEAMFHEFTFPAVLKFLRLWGRYEGRYAVEENAEGNGHLFLIRHDRGPKWSNFYEGFLRGLLQDGLGLAVKVRVTEDSCLVNFEIEEKSRTGSSTRQFDSNHASHFS